MNPNQAPEHSKFHFTENLKFAAALAAAGFRVQHMERIVMPDGSERFSFELDAKAHGIKATYFLGAFENKFNLAERVDAIIADRGLTEEEVAVLTFDAARSGLQNGSSLLYCGKNRKAIVAKEISGGRTLIYRDGTPRDHLKKLIENA